MQTHFMCITVYVLFSVRECSDSMHLIGNAIGLGTFRTRLETRTKKSNMCASHWVIC
jgi:hypothetical protein